MAEIVLFPARKAEVVPFPAHMTVVRPIPGQEWRHQQGNAVIVIAIATDEATGEEMVVFRSNAAGRVWTCLLSRWNEPLHGRPRYTPSRPLLPAPPHEGA